MNTKMQYQKAIIKEKIEKIRDALDKDLFNFGYFVITTRDKTIVYGVNYKLNDTVKEPFILIYDKNEKVYANIKVKSIIYISPLDFYVK
jgi:hypothetical protein